MIAFLDVHYRLDNAAIAAAVLASKWTASEAELEKTVLIPKVAPYESGEFYKRELPALLAILKALPPVEIVVIDGYVWLDGDRKPGLGARLYDSLERRCPVIGVAKTQFSDFGTELLRAQSTRPLYVTAEGISEEEATRHIAEMPGARLPILLKRVDTLAKEMAFTPDYALWLLKVLETHLWQLAEPWLEVKGAESTEHQLYQTAIRRLSERLADMEVIAAKYHDPEDPEPFRSRLLEVWDDLMIYYARIGTSTRVSRVLLAATGCAVIRNYLRDSIPQSLWVEAAPEFCEQILKFGRTLEPPLLDSIAFKEAVGS